MLNKAWVRGTRTKLGQRQLRRGSKGQVKWQGKVETNNAEETKLEYRAKTEETKLKRGDKANMTNVKVTKWEQKAKAKVFKGEETELKQRTHVKT